VSSQKESRSFFLILSKEESQDFWETERERDHWLFLTQVKQSQGSLLQKERERKRLWTLLEKERERKRLFLTWVKSLFLKKSSSCERKREKETLDSSRVFFWEKETLDSSRVSPRVSFWEKETLDSSRVSSRVSFWEKETLYSSRVSFWLKSRVSFSKRVSLFLSQGELFFLDLNQGSFSQEESLSCFLKENSSWERDPWLKSKSVTFSLFLSQEESRDSWETEREREHWLFLSLARRERLQRDTKEKDFRETIDTLSRVERDSRVRLKKDSLFWLKRKTSERH